MADNVVYDVDGYEVVTKALMSLINQFPGLAEGDEITFGSLADESGKALYPVSGAMITSETDDVTGHCFQNCAYPFYVIYRSAGLTEMRRINIKEWLDDIGRWLEKQNVKINGTEYQLTEYPTLTGTREFKSIKRSSPSFPYATSEDGTEEWAITMQALYINEFDKEN